MSEFSIDPGFSVYGLVQRVKQSATMVSHRKTMTYISYEIENATLIDKASPIIFSGFQRLSKFMPQIRRYQRLAKRAKAVYVFGEADMMPPEIENVTYVPLKPDDQLVKEWFLVSYCQTYFSALATEELTSIEDPDDERQFRGLWSFDLDLVVVLHQWLASSVGLRTNILDTDLHDFATHRYLMRNTIARMNTRLLGGHWQYEAPVIKQELHDIVDKRLTGELAALGR